MAKVMISLPDDLLARLDATAKARGRTRSAFLRELAEREVADDVAARQRAVEDILARATPQDGRAVEWVREDRER